MSCEAVDLKSYILGEASREERREIFRKVPEGLRYLLASRSDKNVGKSTSYPRRLTLLELAGVASGPFAYARSVRARSRQPWAT